MTRPRGRPARGQGVTRDAILDAALDLLDEDGDAGLTMRALAARLGVTPMSLYHHVTDRAGLLRALSDRLASPAESTHRAPARCPSAVRTSIPLTILAVRSRRTPLARSRW